MRLLIVSHTPHYRRGGELAGWGPTVREIDALAGLFDSVVHVAPLHAGPAPPSALAYRSERVRVRVVEPAGGERWRDKLAILGRAPRWARAIARELRDADVAQVRCPAGISLVALGVLSASARPVRRWAKYAGAWRPAAPDAWSNRVQRWWLERAWRGVVTINGAWPGQPAHLHSFLNPCLTDEELSEAQEPGLRKELARPLRLAFVGRLEPGKGADTAVRVIARLPDATLTVAGDGPERARLERLAGDTGAGARIRWLGALPRQAVGDVYAAAHLLLLPSRSEGWPKAASEAMAYGVVPLAGAVGSIPELLGRFGTGRALDPSDVEGFTEAIRWYAEHPETWKEESRRGLRAAEQFTYSRYLEAVERLLAFGRAAEGAACET